MMDTNSQWINPDNRNYCTNDFTPTESIPSHNTIGINCGSPPVTSIGSSNENLLQHLAIINFCSITNKHAEPEAFLDLHSVHFLIGTESHLNQEITNSERLSCIQERPKESRWRSVHINWQKCFI